MEKTRKKLELTKKGHLALWEWGGGFTSTGDATIICNNDGSRKKAIYIKRRGHRANESHALVLVNVKDFIINVFRRRDNYIIKVYQIVDFVKEEYPISDGRTLIDWYAVLEEKYNCNNKTGEVSCPEFLKEAIEAGKEKSNCYHCREPHYVK